MLANRTFKLVLFTLLWTLPMGFGNSTNAQEVATPWTAVDPTLRKLFNCSSGRCPSAAPVARSGVSPRRQRPATGATHPASFATLSKIEGVIKHGVATAIHYENNYYIVSCAHIWGGTGYRHYIVYNGQEIEVEILGVKPLDDLAILKAVSGLPCMDLNLQSPSQGSRLNLGYRPGVFMGYRGVEIIAKGYVKNGDSGGPIFNNNGLLGIIASYEYLTGTDPLAGQTSGPCATHIANFIDSLSASPSLPIPPADPVQEPELNLTPLLDRITALETREPELEFAPLELAPLLARISELEKLPLQLQTLSAIVAANSGDISALRTRTIDLETQARAHALDLQSISSVVEVLNKEVIAVTAFTLELEKVHRASALRIQQLELSTSTLMTSSSSSGATSGKVNFRLRVDQSGRVISVEPR